MKRLGYILLGIALIPLGLYIAFSDSARQLPILATMTQARVLTIGLMLFVTGPVLLWSVFFPKKTQ
jgi:hypothetical protein